MGDHLPVKTFFGWLATQRKREDAIGLLGKTRFLTEDWPAIFSTVETLQRNLRAMGVPEAVVETAPVAFTQWCKEYERHYGITPTAASQKKNRKTKMSHAV